MRLTVAILLVGLGLQPVWAEELIIGLASEPSSMDPHYHNLGPNNAMRNHIFESLISQDEKQRLHPELAVSWEAVDDLTWEIKLREDVTFHDGSPFTADDVVYTLERIPNVPNSPSSFEVYTQFITEVETPDDHTLVLKTAEPYPLLPVSLSTFGIMSRQASAGKFSEQLNAGDGTAGTGPYRFVEFVKGDRLVLERYQDYWGDIEPWSKVTFRPISSAPARTAALLAGDVDFIEQPSSIDVPDLKENDDIRVVEGLSNRVIYLHLDHHAEPSPGIEGTDGANPFKDKKVRSAVSKAIDRAAIVERIMGSSGMVAGQLLPPGMFGHNSHIEPEQADPEAAKALLAEAGYPEGFSLILGTPNDRYINDAKVAQAIAAMLTRVGIETTVDAMTKSVFFSRRNEYDFSLYLAGWGSGTGEMSSPLKALVATQDSETGMGGTNRGRYSNPAMDNLLKDALTTIDDAEREKLLQAASRVVIEDYGILPLHYEVTPWAMETRLTYTPRTDQYTLATGIRPAE